jgi:SAM-dependent methyltransferase
MIRRPWNHNIHYYGLVLTAAPPGCRRALDVGCGQGLLARRLAQRCQEVIAIDMDHDVISRARVGDGLEERIKFVEGDVMTYPFSDKSFELITAVATLHHFPLRPALQRFRQLLIPGGVLAIIGLYRGETFSDRVLAAAAFPVSWMFRSFRGYADVGAPVQDPTETLREIRSACDRFLPGASLRRHLLFRYSLIWRKSSV